MLGASHILDFVMKLWAKKMTKMYGERGEVYRIYFENPGASNNPCFRLYSRKDF
jgi:hypothetical protein